MSAIEPPNQSHTVVPQREIRVENTADNTQSSKQQQALLSQGDIKEGSQDDNGSPTSPPQASVPQQEVKDGGKGGGAQSSNQLPALTPRQHGKIEAMADDASSSKPRPPFDPFPLMYWLLFILIVPTITFWMLHKPVPQVSLPLLNHEVPAYHIITARDISLQQFDQSRVTGDTVRIKDDLIGHYTLVTIQKGEPIHKNQIAPQPPTPPPDASLITNTLVVAIPANSTMILGGNLHAGDTVKLAAVPTLATGSPNSQTVIVFDKVLVLDIKLAGNQSVIVLAIPADRWLDYLAKTRNATVVLERQVE